MKYGLPDLIKEQLKKSEDLEEARSILSGWLDFFERYIRLQDFMEEHKERKPRKKSYYQRNKERLRAYQRAYVKAHKEK